MFKLYLNFLRGITTNWIVALGVALTTASFLLFIIFLLLSLAGAITNAYVGLLIYLTLPASFVLGVLLIPIGWLLHKRRSGKTTKELLAERFGAGDVQPRFYGSNIVGIILLLTVMNLVFFGGASMKMLHFMDQASFCGTACHVMKPEWTVYQESPHARVDCVDCHVGESTEAIVQSKFSGMRQMVQLARGSYEQPIPTPVHQLRPSRETCENCHWAEKKHGRRLKLITRYQMDEASTPRYTALNIKIGSNDGGRRVIHWHASKDDLVRYASVGDKREEIIWVEAMQEDGVYKRYTNRTLVSSITGDEIVRSMDCVDCHNRVTHVYEDPSDGIDWRIAEGMLDRSLPYLKREALAAVARDYPDMEAAMEGIERRLQFFYRRNYPDLATAKQVEIDSAVSTLQAFYLRNIHPEMSVTWNSYPNQLGHRARAKGCFRCHNENILDEEGKPIEDECTLCHSIIANDSPDPFRFQMAVQEEGDPDAPMHRYLKEEFLSTLR
ncbi:MAG: NapC/NirT family cytochrome c [Deltaproteobacteria bacterium]|nr:NapC/NirT family cytochrome c [Deltaproteobacteria bacterium]